MRYGNSYIEKIFGPINYSENQAVEIYGDNIWGRIYYAMSCMLKSGYSEQNAEEFLNTIIHTPIQYLNRDINVMIKFCKENKRN